MSASGNRLHMKTRRPALGRPACSKAEVLLDFLLIWDQFGT